MKPWCSSLIIVLTFTAFCWSDCKVNNVEQESQNSSETDSETNILGCSKNCSVRFLQPINLEPQVAEDPNSCKENEIIQCDPTYPYRMINGTCNNLNNPNWGSSAECYLRITPAVYKGFGSIRSSINGGPLPEPRDLTLNIFKNVHQPTRNVSFMFTIFGQTVAHDVSFALQDYTPGRCCVPENRAAPGCMPIPVPSYDPFYSKFNVTCLEMNRTAPCDSCQSANRQQSNGATNALDASIVYGSDDNKARLIRLNDGTGKLKSNDSEIGELLPTGKDPSDLFCYKSILPQCFLAGDARVNQHSTLTGLQTLYMREHNRIATQLKILNPHWDEERLFQEARRINIAEFQCITYKEYLPYLLGPSLMEQFDLTVKNGSEGSKYNPQTRLGVWNEFATAAFRLHSMVAKEVGALNLEFKNLYSNPGLIRHGHMGDILQGVCKVASEKYDHYYVDDVTDYLYQDVPFGTDLSSTDMQRGRDHGLAPYVELVRYCFGSNANISSFKDLAPSLMSQENANLLEENYKSVEDIDLLTGVQLENHLEGSEIGPTAACIISQQMYALKFGDRFYFEHEGEVASFTPDQRASLKDSSLSRMLCDNTDIRDIQMNTMLLADTLNPKVPCNLIPSINLTLWREKPSE